MGGDVPGADHEWLDCEAGPVVRPYTMTGGRVQPGTDNFDLVAFVQASPAQPGADPPPHPEQQAILALVQEPISVAEISAHLDLALGVVRVLLGDLLAAELIETHEPSAAHLPDDDILKAVLHGLRAL
ncbi:MAG TPA: DUF742 domain-containing protein [Micromonospora sp.]|nr:DUF742 domain-containing protein [Micromonospora sp.]